MLADNLYPTHILQNLIRRSLLDDRLRRLSGGSASRISRFLRKADSPGVSFSVPEMAEFVPVLLKYGFISLHPMPGRSRCSLLAVTGVNFELTYDCNLNCAHCLQQGIRRFTRGHLSAQAVKGAVFQVYLGGLCTSGVNFTGGEVLGHRNDFFEIAEYTGSLGIPYRLNTNCWWSRKFGLELSGRRFESPLDLAHYLKSIGLGQFAFSYDERMLNADLFDNLVAAIKLCEIARIGYQIIFTGVDPAKIGGIINELRKAAGSFLYYLVPVSAETIDIGGCTRDNGAYAWQSNKADCRDKGFYHPAFLHISPDGKVRTCMYAVGSANVGDIAENVFADLINGFPGNATSRCFTSPTRKQAAFNNLVVPYLASYRPFIHECTRNAVLVRTIQTHFDYPDLSLAEIHFRIGRDLNLAHR
ncbi:4Fe-4S cluster-binding domain-containing protein [Dehalogenimonas sp. 4OHTPN]|uniref:4Fe-4S cluster-binding domain-containing protein n=1 Tax=Dehalogenimonas sp. 4OHTPN TaxID=3166643 RepID=A0AAU8GAD9_9CHLR